MSVQSEIGRIENERENISKSIRQKGVDVPQGSKLNSLAGYIGKILTGIQSQTITAAEVVDELPTDFDNSTLYFIPEKKV